MLVCEFSIVGGTWRSVEQSRLSPMSERPPTSIYWITLAAMPTSAIFGWELISDKRDEDFQVNVLEIERALRGAL